MKVGQVALTNPLLNGKLDYLLLLLSPLAASTVTLCAFYFCILILTPTALFCCLSKKAPFLLLEELRLRNITRTCSVSRYNQQKALALSANNKELEIECFSSLAA